MSAGDDFYAVLGVPRDASMVEIKKAYRALARALHPDVVGPDLEKSKRFKMVTHAYETLSDPDARGSYDRRFQRRTPGRMAGGFRPWDAQQSKASEEKGSGPSLDDLFSQDFGFGGKRSRNSGGSPGKSAPSGASSGARWHEGGASVRGRPTGSGKDDFGSASSRPGGSQPGSSQPNHGSYGGDGNQPGQDIKRVIDVPVDVLEHGGTVTLHYTRMRRTDDGRGLFEYDEIHDLKVPPGTPHGATLRARGWGHGGLGAIHGDLVCDIRAVGGEKKKPTSKTTIKGGPADQVRVDLSVSQALLGGRVEVQTPQGPIKLTVPPCTSGGAMFRLKGRGERDAQGKAGDLLVRLRIVVPPVLDDESIALIERFAELND
ncbi:MAG: DnaJ-class molecular chaperone [Cognaticolwellia sp.]|jgi:DnaJ-class molecular chaperone